MRDFEKLEVWRTAHELALIVYRLTARFPRHERAVLVDQMRRCGTSVPANIAEGSGLDSNAQLARHLVIASGSSSELEYYARLSHDLGYLSADDHRSLQHQVRSLRRQIWAYIRYLRRS